MLASGLVFLSVLAEAGPQNQVLIPGSSSLPFWTSPKLDLFSMTLRTSAKKLQEEDKLGYKQK